MCAIKPHRSLVGKPFVYMKYENIYEMRGIARHNRRVYGAFITISRNDSRIARARRLREMKNQFHAMLREH
jgi:hypothetical protein